MEAISILIKKEEYYWSLVEFKNEIVICDTFVKKYMGEYSNGALAYLTIRLNKDGLIRFSKFPSNFHISDWFWTFDKFPESVPDYSKVWDTHTMYPEINYLLDELSHSNNDITDFRADLYMTDIEEPFILRGTDSLELIKRK